MSLTSLPRYGVAMRGLLAALLALQVTNPLTLEEEERRLRQRDWGARTALVMIIAQHADGSPARGVIACDGLWVKYQDCYDPEICTEEPYVENLAFKTDSRGAVVFNPPTTYFDLACTAVDEHRHHGRIVIEVEPLITARLTVR